MTQLELLWIYQQADIAAEKCDTTMKRSPTRLRLLKCQEQLRNQKETNDHLEDEANAMLDRMEALKDGVAMCEAQLKELHMKYEATPPQTSEQVKEYADDVNRIIQTLANYESEIRRLRKDALDRENQQKDIIQRASRIRGEYDQLKREYDKEFEANKAQLEQLRATAAEKAKDISLEYMDKYRKIKQHSMPPLAELRGDQCGGCRMSLPSAVLRQVRSGKEVECESCGRLLILLPTGN